MAWTMVPIAIGVFLCTVANGCSVKEEEVPSKVEVRLDGPREEVGCQVVVLEERSAIQKAASFFPGMLEDRASLTAGNWGPRIRFTFTRHSGDTVTVVSNYEYWNTVTGGDLEVEGDLHAYAVGLFGKAASR